MENGQKLTEHLFSVPIFKDQDSLEICDKKLGPLCVEKPVYHIYSKYSVVQA